MCLFRKSKMDLVTKTRGKFTLLLLVGMSLVILKNFRTDITYPIRILQPPQSL